MIPFTHDLERAELAAFVRDLAARPERWAALVRHERHENGGTPLKSTRP